MRNLWIINRPKGSDGDDDRNKHTHPTENGD